MAGICSLFQRFPVNSLNSQSQLIFLWLILSACWSAKSKRVFVAIFQWLLHSFCLQRRQTMTTHTAPKQSSIMSVTLASLPRNAKWRSNTLLDAVHKQPPMLFFCLFSFLLLSVEISSLKSFLSSQKLQFLLLSKVHSSKNWARNNSCTCMTPGKRTKAVLPSVCRTLVVVKLTFFYSSHCFIVLPFSFRFLVFFFLLPLL